MMSAVLVLFVQGVILTQKSTVRVVSENNVELGKSVQWGNDLGYVGYVKEPGVAVEAYAGTYKHLSVNVGASWNKFSPAVTFCADPLGYGFSGNVQGLGLASGFMISTRAALVLAVAAYAGYKAYRSKYPLKAVEDAEKVDSIEKN